MIQDNLQNKYFQNSVSKKLFQKNANLQNEGYASILPLLKNLIALAFCASKFP